MASINCLLLQHGGQLLLQDGSGCFLLQLDVEAPAEATGGWENFVFDRVREVLPAEIPVEPVLQVLESTTIEVRQLPQGELIPDREVLAKAVTSEILARLPEPPADEIDRHIQLEFAILALFEQIENEMISMLLLGIDIEQPARPLTIAEWLLLLA